MFVAARPVLERAQLLQLGQQILAMTSADTVSVYVTHTARVITRIANNRVKSLDDGDTLRIEIHTQYGGRAEVWTSTNQITEGTLRALVAQCETLARAQIGGEELLHKRQEPDMYVPVALWHETTVAGMTAARDTVVPALIERVRQHGLTAAGFVGLMARSTAVFTKEGITAVGDETDSEVTITAQTPNGTRSGWAGQAARDWATIDYQHVADEAARLALTGKEVQAIEPGRRTAILGPAAVVQLMRYFAQEFDAYGTNMGQTGFSKASGGNKIGQRVFDPRITMRSDPADPEGGYYSFFSQGFGNPAMTWVEQGVLKNLAYSPDYGPTQGKAYAENPVSLRIEGGTSSLPDMIAACAEGIYVNRLADVSLLDKGSGMLSGVTRDGCFLVRHGKIDRPVKNFRILDSPFFLLNKLEALGPTARAPFGYTPPSDVEQYDPRFTWPRRPMIVPPMMVRDCNFSSLADAV